MRKTSYILLIACAVLGSAAISQAATEVATHKAISAVSKTKDVVLDIATINPTDYSFVMDLSIPRYSEYCPVSTDADKTVFVFIEPVTTYIPRRVDKYGNFWY